MLPAGGLAGRTRAMLKVEDGCVNFCTYCIIPYARGPVRSLPAGPRPWSRRGRWRQRATGRSCSPASRSPPGARTCKNGSRPSSTCWRPSAAAAPAVRICGWAAWSPGPSPRTSAAGRPPCPNLCPQFHLSMQSGCDDTLQRMNRKYDTARYCAVRCTCCMQYFDHPAVTTDLIIGLPRRRRRRSSPQTLDFIRRVRLRRRCTFSPTPSAPAPRRPRCRQVPKAVKEERARQAAAVAEALHRNYLAACVGADVSRPL